MGNTSLSGSAVSGLKMTYVKRMGLGILFLGLLALPIAAEAQAQTQPADSTSEPATISPAQLAGYWLQPLVHDCFLGSCTDALWLYAFTNDCVNGLCRGSRQGWINTGSGWRATQVAPFSFVWTIQNNQLYVWFPHSSRTEVFQMQAYDAGNNRLFMSSADTPYTVFYRYNL